MAATTARDLRDLEEKELTELIQSTRRDLFGLRFQLATGGLENTAGLRNQKRALARAITVAHERGIDTNEIR